MLTCNIWKIYDICPIIRNYQQKNTSCKRSCAVDPQAKLEKMTRTFQMVIRQRKTE